MLSVGEDFVILACVFFTQCQRVTDGTDRRTQTSRRWLVQACITRYTDARKNEEFEVQKAKKSCCSKKEVKERPDGVSDAQFYLMHNF